MRRVVYEAWSAMEEDRTRLRPLESQKSREDMLLEPQQDWCMTLLPERIKSKIKKSADLFHGSPCWVWLAQLSQVGYGCIKYEGKKALAHRIIYQLLKGPILHGLQLDHLCRVRECVNPAHMEPVTCAENLRRGLTSQVAAARERAKTHCPYGHPYDEANTYMGKNSAGRRGRVCRKCNNISTAKRRRRRNHAET